MMAILHVRPSLAGQHESQSVEDPTNLAWLQHGRPWHVLRGYRDALGADELSLQIRFAILQ